MFPQTLIGWFILVRVALIGGFSLVPVDLIGRFILDRVQGLGANAETQKWRSILREWHGHEAQPGQRDQQSLGSFEPVVNTF